MNLRTQPNLVLASASPRRHELLSVLGLTFQVEPSLLEESSLRIPPAHPEAYVRALAMLKAEEVAERCRNAIILGADTVVVLRSRILGKPADLADACRMLQSLRGRTHQVYTGVAILRVQDGLVTARAEDYTRTDVRMKPFSTETLHAYLDTGEPMDKAGGYAIQGKGALLVDGITGDYHNVVGLPIARVAEMLEEFGVRVL